MKNSFKGLVFVVVAMMLVGCVSNAPKPQFKPLPMKDQPTLTGLVEVVKNLAIMVVGYWLGSSNAAATKTVAPKQ